MNDLSPFRSFDVVEEGIHRGVRWAVARSPMSTDDYLQPNGYVELPEDHITRYSELQFRDVDVYDVHGGITFQGDRTIGFDTNHCSDYSAGFKSGRRWSIDDARAETIRLADQVADYHTPEARADHAAAERLRTEANQIDPTTRKA